VLLIEDSKHYQNLVRLLLRQHFPEVELHVADDGIAGLAMAGQLQPDCWWSTSCCPASTAPR
jgi:CheY-like chemotaxis protein